MLIFLGAVMILFAVGLWAAGIIGTEFTSFRLLVAAGVCVLLLGAGQAAFNRPATTSVEVHKA